MKWEMRGDTSLAIIIICITVGYILDGCEGCKQAQIKTEMMRVELEQAKKAQS